MFLYLIHIFLHFSKKTEEPMETVVEEPSVAEVNMLQDIAEGDRNEYRKVKIKMSKAFSTKEDVTREDGGKESPSPTPIALPTISVSSPSMGVSNEFSHSLEGPSPMTDEHAASFNASPALAGSTSPSLRTISPANTASTTINEASTTLTLVESSGSPPPRKYYDIPPPSTSILENILLRNRDERRSVSPSSPTEMAYSYKKSHRYV